MSIDDRFYPFTLPLLSKLRCGIGPISALKSGSSILPTSLNKTFSVSLNFPWTLWTIARRGTRYEREKWLRSGCFWKTTEEEQEEAVTGSCKQWLLLNRLAWVPWQQHTAADCFFKIKIKSTQRLFFFSWWTTLCASDLFCGSSTEELSNHLLSLASTS